MTQPPNVPKKGLLKLEGAKPMELVESDDGLSIKWPPEQEAAAIAISRAIKSYIKTAKELVNGKYASLRDKIPEYLATPGNLIIAICTDGIVVRYEKETGAERKIVVTAFPNGIAEIAAMLSQNLIHIESPEAPHPKIENFGVEFKLSLVSPEQGVSEDLITNRIWFQTKLSTPQQTATLGAKPYCLLSVRNQLEIELHGELSDERASLKSGQPFITRSAIRLLAGWECIEVYPSLQLDTWNSDFAPLWAENDILGAVLIAQTKDSRLSALDPRAATRRQYSSLLADFKAILDSNPDREQVLQTFLQDNPILLCPTHVRMWPKLPLGAKITDFVFRDATQEYLLVELERSTLQLFRQDGHATSELTHAHGQIIDWKRYLEDNLHTVQKELGLEGITPNPNGLLVIGRSHSLQPRDRRKLQTMTSESPKLRIMTYDDVYENAKAVFENLLGPMWDMGGNTQTYFPHAP